jgi:hypothetical protein
VGLVALAIASMAGVVALLLLTTLSTVIAVSAPVTAGVLLVLQLGTTPATGARALDTRRIDRTVERIVIVLIAAALAYIILAGS